MTDILLLSGEPEGRFLKEQLLTCRPELTIHHALDGVALREQSLGLSPNARLISFCTATIVPRDIIERFSGNCYNFHPAPPDYPGYRPSGFALYQGETDFGVTAHHLIEEIDAGAIVGADFFPISPAWSNYELGISAYSALIDLFRSLMADLARIETPLEPIGQECGPHTYKKRDYEAMKCIKAPLSPDELEKRYRCFDGIYCSWPPE